jgi:hypothetical protein
MSRICIGLACAAALWSVTPASAGLTQAERELIRSRIGDVLAA